MNLTSYLYSNSRLAGTFLQLSLRMKLYYFYNLNYMRKCRMSKAGSEEYEAMLRAQSYFERESKRVEDVKMTLSDNTSRITYQKLIKMRQYYRRDDIPYYNYFDQYFPKQYIQLSPEEVFVDCGAFNGDSIKKFIKQCPDYKAIVAFEPDPCNIQELKSNLRKQHDLVCVEAGCSDEIGTAYFDCEESSGSSRIADNVTSTKINLTTIDSVDDCHDATFIKMDIEGAEMSALRGASKTIMRNHPKLAICLYHSNEDMIRIPEYIHKLVPEYKLYVCAHTMGIAETVLYAIDDMMWVSKV